jgi:hypothetical protein
MAVLDGIIANNGWSDWRRRHQARSAAAIASAELFKHEGHELRRGRAEMRWAWQ